MLSRHPVQTEAIIFSGGTGFLNLWSPEYGDVRVHREDVRGGWSWNAEKKTIRIEFQNRQHLSYELLQKIPVRLFTVPDKVPIEVRAEIVAGDAMVDTPANVSYPQPPQTPIRAPPLPYMYENGHVDKRRRIMTTPRQGGWGRGDGGAGAHGIAGGNHCVAGGGKGGRKGGMDAGVGSWEEERRHSRDGNLYTQREFYEWYRGTDQGLRAWEDARREERRLGADGCWYSW